MVHNRRDHVDVIINNAAWRLLVSSLLLVYRLIKWFADNDCMLPIRRLAQWFPRNGSLVVTAGDRQPRSRHVTAWLNTCQPAHSDLAVGSAQITPDPFPVQHLGGH